MPAVDDREPRARRPPRPTIRFLGLLPQDSFPDERDAQAIRDKRWKELSIGDVRHPLIDDALKLFARGMPEQHKTSSRSAGQPVYEVRSRGGAAWRGAVVLDEAGDPWLVWADKHDQFNSHAKSVLTKRNLAKWMPHEVEYKLRAREEAASRRKDWKRSVISSFLRLLADVVENPKGEVVSSLDGFTSEDARLSVTVAMEHDAPESSPELATSLARVFIRVGHHAESELRDELLACVLPVLQPDRNKIDATFGRDGQLDVWIVLTHAKVTQLLAASEVSSDGLDFEATVLPNTHLHYVSNLFLTEAMVTGASTRGVCGRWFVPTMDENAGLPICPQCDEQRPFAQRAADIIRSTVR